MTTKISELFADLDCLDFDSTIVTVTCTTSSRRYIYFRVTVTAKRSGREFAASYESSNLNHQNIKGDCWAAYYLPCVQRDLTEIVESRTYRANSNIFRALRAIANEALAFG